MGKKKRRIKGNNQFTRAKAKEYVSIAPTPFNGDHGTGTQAANWDTEIVAIKDSPNRMGYRKRRDRVSDIEDSGEYTLRQWQAALELQTAWALCDKLSSGGPLKEQVDSSPKPDAAVASQVEAQARLAAATKGVLRIHRQLVEDVCFHNLHWAQIRHRHGPLYRERLQNVFDRVADYLGY